MIWFRTPDFPYRSRLEISNRRVSPQFVAVEPWGEDFWLMPGEDLEVVAFGDVASPRFDLVKEDGSCVVHCEDTVDFHVLQDGVRLKCGHNRPRSDRCS